MGFFILLFFLLLLLIGGVVVGRAMKASDPAGPGGLVAVGSVIGFFVLLVLLVGIRSFHTVGNGEIGIVKQFGPVVGTTNSGFVTIAPWRSIDNVSVKNELRTYDMDTKNSAVSADSQAIYMTVQVNYNLERDKAVALYRKTGGDFVNRILDPNVFQLTKEVTAEYKATEVASNREKIRREIEQRLGDAVAPLGLHINSVALKNVHFTAALTHAIEQTVEARQLALRAEAQVKIKEAEAQQQIASARGDATSQRLRQSTLTPLLIQQQAIQKLNPNVQVIFCGSTKALCIPNAGAALVGGAASGKK